MQVEIKKQVTTKVEIHTPCFFKTEIGRFYHINQHGVLMVIHPYSQITVWHPEHHMFYSDSVEEMLKHGSKCDATEFQKAYTDTKNAMGLMVNGLVAPPKSPTAVSI